MGESRKILPHFCIFALLFFFCANQVALYIQPHRVGLPVGVHRDALMEMPRQAIALVRHIDSARFAREHRFLRIFGHGASARSPRLVDDQRRIAHVGKRKSACHRPGVYRHGAEVVRGFIKLDVRLCLRRNVAEACHHHH